VEACLRESKRFLDDLVMLARTGGVQMDRSRADLSGILQEVMFEQRELLSDRGIQVTTSADLPAVWCNPARVKQVLTNLIRNAARHGCNTKEPRISVVRWTDAIWVDQVDNDSPGSPHPAGAPTSDPSVWLAVCDNGPGIPVESRDEVFLPGRRLAGAHPDGSGMGLSIVKRIVEYYGGRAYVDPRQQGGTAVVFSFPAAPD
jgi:signal transduction histidine kinase